MVPWDGTGAGQVTCCFKTHCKALPTPLPAAHPCNGQCAAGCGDPSSPRHPPALWKAAEVPTPPSAVETFVSLRVILSP